MPCTLALSDVPKINGVRRLKLLKDVVGYDNCWNQPGRLELRAGTVLSISSDGGTERGDVFFSSPGHSSASVGIMPPAFKSRYPYDLGVFDPDYLEPVQD